MNAPATTQPDLVIRNARIVDGSGRPAVSGDVAVRGDRIAAVGEIAEQGAMEIDAGGKVLAPGFIDIHTHYDPQLCWDRLATPTPEHGVTSLVMGNCSISLAPVRPADVKKVIHLFGSVEDMEGRLLEETVPFAWETVPQYLDYLRQGLGPNVGVLIGHSVLRLYVMGAAAQQRAASEEEIARMADLLGEAIDVGALGLSFTFTHLDETGGALPCSYAERGEIAALMLAMKARGRGIVEVSPQPLSGMDIFERIDQFGALALETGVTVTISPILQVPSMAGREQELLARITGWRAKGAPIFAQTQTRPLDMTIRLDQGSPILGKGQTWRRIMDMPVTERIAAFSNPALRDPLYAEAADIADVFDKIVLKETRTPANQRYLRQSLNEIAAASGRRFTDAFIDISLDDNLEAVFSLENFVHADVGIVSALLDDPAI
ncbi:MAG: amidohydrolase family protein, partial [Sphingobium sp.]